MFSAGPLSKNEILNDLKARKKKMPQRKNFTREGEINITAANGGNGKKI